MKAYNSRSSRARSVTVHVVVIRRKRKGQIMKEYKVNILGYEVDVVNYGNATYLYPAFNGNFEVRASHKGFRKLSHYLRIVTWIEKTRKEIFG